MLSGLPGFYHLHTGEVGNLFPGLLAWGFTVIYSNTSRNHSGWFWGASGCSGMTRLLSIDLDLWCLSVPHGGNSEPDHPILVWCLSDQEVRNQWSCKILQPLEKTYKWSWTCQAQHIFKSNLVLIKFILTLEGRGGNHIFYDSSLPQDNKTWSEDIKNMWLQTSFLPLELSFPPKSSSHHSTEPCSPVSFVAITKTSLWDTKQLVSLMKPETHHGVKDAVFLLRAVDARVSSRHLLKTTSPWSLSDAQKKPNSTLASSLLPAPLLLVSFQALSSWYWMVTACSMVGGQQ